MDNNKMKSDGFCRILLSLLLALLFCLLMGSCKTRQSVISTNSSRHDSVWTVQVVQNGRGDSIVYKERVEVIPRFIHVGDTTIVSMDTIINRSTDRTVTTNNNFYYGNGSSSKDTILVEARNTAPQQPARVKLEFKWKAFWYGILVGVILISLALYGFALYREHRRKTPDSQ